MQQIAGAVLAASLLAAGAIPAAAEAASAGVTTGVTVTVVASGLNAPRHLTLTRSGLFVAEAGAGGAENTANCVTDPGAGPALTQYCVGLTGAVSLITSSGVTASFRLPSVIEEDTKEVAGPGAVAFNRDGQVAVTIQDVLVNKDGVNPLPRPLGAAFGKLLLRRGGRVIAVDLAAFAAAHPQPDSSLGTLPGELRYDSDPFDVVAYRGGFIVADAAANDLLEVSAQGTIRLLARFPALAELVPAHVLGNPTPITIKAQAVPTSVAVGPDGALYVGLLRGVPSDPGTAYIYRVVPGQQPTIWARGLTAVTAIAFDHYGRLLATEFSTGGLLAPGTVPGALVRISDNGQTVTTLPVSGLYQPTGVAVGHGVVYVSNYGYDTATDADPGEVLKITGLS